MAHLIIPISISFMGGGMPWTLVGEVSTEWTSATVSRPYVASGYIVVDYFEDEEWAFIAEPADTWVLA